MKRLSRADVLLALIIAGVGVWLGLRLLSDYRAAGGRPSFQQSAFGPAVLTACGRGYQNPDDESIPALKAFLASEREAFDCRELPSAIPTLPLRPFHRVTRYMELVVAAVWRTGTITWSSIDRLNAAGFGIDLAILFLLCRAFAGRALSVAAAAAWAISPLHLAMAMDLRDYVKAPFILGAATLIAWMLRSESPRRAWLGAAAAVVAGVGSGFRTDVLLVVVPVVIAVALAGAPRARTGLLVAAASVVLFTVAALPILRGYTGGGVISHVVLLGLTSPFDAKLGLETPEYRVGPAYHDAYVFSLVWDWKNRAHGEDSARAMTFGSAEHDAATTAYFQTVLTRLPADFLFRALAAGRKSVTVMFAPPYDEPLPWIRAASLRRAIELRGAVLPALLMVLPLALLYAWIAATRAGWTHAASIAVLALTFPAASALQFHDRHVFYLEVIPLCALVAAASGLWRLARGAERTPRQGDDRAGAGWWIPSRPTAAALAGAAGVAAIVAVGVAATRYVQSRQLTDLFNAYERLPAMPVQWQVRPTGTDLETLVPLSFSASSVTAPLSVIEFDRSRCGLALFRFVMRYRSPAAVDDVSFDGWINLLDSSRMRFYAPVVAVPRLGIAFEGLELPAGASSCVAGWTVADVPAALPKFIAHLPEDWRGLPLRQQPISGSGGIPRRDSYLYINQMERPVEAAVLRPDMNGVIERIDDRRPNGYLFRAAAATVRQGDTFVLEGTADEADFIVGLQSEELWGEVVKVARPGRFVVLLRPKSAGSYRVVIADGGGGKPHGIAITRAGWLSPGP